MMDLGRYVHIVYRDRGRVIHDEVLCRHHFEDMAHHGAYGASDWGKTIDVQPWKGEERCSSCDPATTEDVRPAV